MHPTLLQMIANDRAREIERAAASPLHRRPQPPQPTGDPVALRLDRVQDHEALLALAALEGRTLPPGPFIVGEVAGAIVAALSLETGTRLADPFRATAEILPLLSLRADQIAPRRRARRTSKARAWIASRG